MEIKHCVNHPDRHAIGVCVITKKPICPECSTKYEGVNYSREGLEELKRRRAQKTRSGIWSRAANLAMVAQAPLSFYLLYLCYLYTFNAFTGLAK
ncbi:MAG: hypothetical protein OEY50_08870 [Nitrospinota bacterium]|nr:hypothetical protein [Nitrospinota bacterium]MDH5677959.1 hypothetical protein [Nitrospinota bacterium]MDH5756516.1 hypothetical protein [Nitrospinota bacterium]